MIQTYSRRTYALRDMGRASSRPLAGLPRMDHAALPSIAGNAQDARKLCPFPPLNPCRRRALSTLDTHLTLSSFVFLSFFLFFLVIPSLSLVLGFLLTPWFFWGTYYCTCSLGKQTSHFQLEFPDSEVSPGLRGACWLRCMESLRSHTPPPPPPPPLPSPLHIELVKGPTRRGKRKKGKRRIPLPRLWLGHCCSGLSQARLG